MNILSIISNDWHIKDDNCDKIIDLVDQKISYANEVNCDTLFCLGDVFTSRKSQTLRVLNTFQRILDNLHKNNKVLYVIPGNHDKTVGESVESYLDPFNNHPAMRLIREYDYIDIDNVRFHFIPYFTLSVWLDYLNQAKSNIDSEKLNILLSHIAVNGSQNIEGFKIKSELKVSMLGDFNKVLLGHYHNKHHVGKNIYHLPSICQNNFGENEEKGVTQFCEDGSFNHVQLKFKKFVSVNVNLNSISKKELNDLITEKSKQVDSEFIRFKFSGSEDKIKSLNKESIAHLGIKVVIDNDDINFIEDFDSVSLVRYDNESIIDEFKSYCEEFDKDYDDGIKYLK